MATKSKITFAQAALAAIEDAQTRVAMGANSKTLVRDYKHRLRTYCEPYFGKTKAVDIDGRSLRAFRTWLATEKGLKASTILTIMSFVSVVLKMAEDDGVIDRIPTVPRKGQRDCPRPWFTRDQYQALLAFLKKVEAKNPEVKFRGNAVDSELRAVVTFLVNSFLRPGDIFTLQHKHVAIVPDGNKAFLRLSLPPSKGHTYPVITMPVAVPIYERVRDRHARSGLAKPDDYVFYPERQNRAYAHELVRRQFTQILRLMGMKETVDGGEHTLYSLRHTAIMFRLLNADGLDLLTLARAARTSVEMIDRFYARPLTAEMNRDRLHSFRHETRFAA
ncbi:tyrosine-type recombinase/integrase [Caulobacter sp. RL271]|uniref:Site-specific integrase n=1 Tax=Caulobacter segnis TaxID=88688 RepID=A0ABY4ZST6_9CAUL|nr:phage integrase SAM-like domain-containing protein [Caulobacter segnis]USQ95888.1 site-specific integrase [Caulobacter segnis]